MGSGGANGAEGVEPGWSQLYWGAKVELGVRWQEAKPRDPLSKAELESGSPTANPTFRVEPIEEEPRDWTEPVEVGWKTGCLR